MDSRIAITTVVEGITVTGEIVQLAPDDITVRLLAPAVGAGEVPERGLHVPHFAMAYRQNWLADREGRLTERGRQRGEALLAELYHQHRRRDKEP